MGNSFKRSFIQLIKTYIFPIIIIFFSGYIIHLTEYKYEIKLPRIFWSNIFTFVLFSMIFIKKKYVPLLVYLVLLMLNYYFISFHNILVRVMG